MAWRDDRHQRDGNPDSGGVAAAEPTPPRLHVDVLHPVLSDQLVALGVGPGEPPEPEVWQRMLEMVSLAYWAAEHRNVEAGLPAEAALIALAGIHDELRALAEVDGPVETSQIEHAVAMMDTGAMLIGPDGRIVAVNGPGGQLLAIGDDIVGRFAWEVLAMDSGPGGEPLGRADVLRVARSGRALCADDGRIACSGGALIQAPWRLGALTGPDGRGGAVLLFQDVPSPLAVVQGLRDAPTGLPNLRALHGRLFGEVEHARQAGRPLSLVMLDLDGLALVNQRHGQMTGDEVVRSVGAGLAEQTGPDELIASAGGGTFAWVIPGVDAVRAYTAAERARAVASAAVRHLGIGMITVSAGVCDLRHAETATELFRLADTALSWAKASGRDCTVRYSSDLARLAPMQDGSHDERMRTLGTIRALARAVDAKDASTFRHSERVAALAVRLASQLGWPVTRIALLGEAALVHDVGKIGIPDAVLFKAGPLTVAEYEAVKEHPSLGCRIIEGVLSEEQGRWVLHHHERFDGAGYPDRLFGDEIEDGSLIIALADAWDAMVSTRPYRPALSNDEALSECVAQSGRQFSPLLVDALMQLSDSGALARLASGVTPTPA